MRKRQKRIGRIWFSVIFLIFCFSMNTPFANAGDTFPSKPISLVTAYRAGGTMDTTCRLLIKPLSKILGQPVVVVNKPGGSGRLAFVKMKNEKPDGHLITMGSSFALTLSQVTMDKPGYDLFTDFQPIATVTRGSMVLVTTPDKPYKDWQSLVKYAKENPGLTWASSQMDKLVLKYIGKKEGIQWNPVPYKGGGEMVSMLLGGHVDFAFSGGIHPKYVEAGKMTMLLSFGKGPYKMKGQPEIPSVKSLGYGDIYAENRFIVFGPKGMSPEVTKILADAFKKACDDPEVADAMENKLRFDRIYEGPEETQKTLAGMMESFQYLVKAVGK